MVDKAGDDAARAGQVDWADVRRWRKAERERLVEARLALPAGERARKAALVIEMLDSEIGDPRGETVAVYWPFRGEPDLRGWIEALADRGATPALPVVIEKQHPLVFRAYFPGDRLEKGVWNIPVPAGGDTVSPTIVVSPLVGFDAGNYRLGYGGGFYDRTLAVLPDRRRVIGIGYDFTRLDTIHPQPHDIAMDTILVA